MIKPRGILLNEIAKRRETLDFEQFDYVLSFDNINIRFYKANGYLKERHEHKSSENHYPTRTFPIQLSLDYCNQRNL